MTNNRALAFIARRQDLALMAMLMVSITAMIVPLPTIVMDLLIAVNIAFTMLILVVAVYLKRPEDFTAFPAIILLATTFRLAIAISTTRLILADADAGAIVDTFGNFVTRGSVLVGLVVFLVITTVQFIVITKGAERVAEVAARFTLDGLPGRQMSIDAELRNGDIDSDTAQRRRGQLERENQFFGAMDGAMKFVKGDAIAGLIIVAINLIGGLCVGMLVKGMPAEAAINVYSRLTVGDGLISQIPALIVALCAGTIITRVNSGSDTDLGADIISQLTGKSKALIVAGGAVAMLALVPGFPSLTFAALGAMLAGGGYFAGRREAKEGQDTPDNQPQAVNRLSGQVVGKSGAQGKTGMQGESSSNMVIQVGSAIFAAIDPVTFTAIRDEAMDRIFAKTGLRLPSFGIQPDASLPPDRVCIMLDGVSGFEATVDPACVIAVADEDILKLNGLAVLPLENKWGVRHGHWIEDRDKAVLASAGVKVFGLAQLLAQTGGRFITRNTRHIVGYKHVQTIIRELGSEHESLASQVSQTISAVQLLNLIRKLLAEGVPLLPRRILFEALLEASVTAVGSEHMVRSARSALARQISASLAGEGNVIAGYVLEPDLELALRETIVRGADENSLAPGPVLAASLLEQARMLLARHEIGSPAPVILVVDELRWPLSALLRSKGIEVSVLAFHEIGAEFTFAPVGTISLELNAAGGTARDMAA